MSIEKNMNTRIQHKHDIEANWNKAINFIPKKGELIVYDPDENYDYSRVKIGDGISTVNELPFIIAVDTSLTQSGQAADAKAVGEAITNLNNLVGETKVSEQISNAIAQKSQVQIITEGAPEVLQTLKIHKLTQDEYEQKIADGTVDENALYLTPDEEIDLSGYATEDYVNNAIDAIQTPDVSGQIEKHNTSSDTHNDIRSLIADLDALIGNVKVSSQISTAISDIDYPVDSVNGKTGVINLTASDIGALSIDTEIPSIVGLATELYVDDAISQKSQVQIITWEADD